MEQSKMTHYIEEADALAQALDISDQLTKEILNFIRQDIVKKCVFDCCSFLRRREGFNSEFQRAFKTLSFEEKASFYAEFVKILKSILEVSYQPDVSNFTQKKLKIWNFFNDREGKWELRRVEIDFETKCIRFSSTKHQIDLHNYLIRNSKKTDKATVALESTQSSQVPKTIRISNYKESFEQLRIFLKSLIESAMKDRLQRRIKQSKQQNSPSITKINSSQKFLLLLAEQSDSKRFEEKQLTKRQSSIKTNVKQPLSLRRDISYIVVKKYFESKNIYIKNHLEWLAASFMNQDEMYSWKATLKEVKIIQSKINKAESKIFLEEHEFKSSFKLNHIYRREKLQHTDSKLLFLDTTQQIQNLINFPQIHLGINIEYILWEFSYNHHKISTSVKAWVHYDLTVQVSLAKQLTQLFLGQVNHLVEGTFSNSMKNNCISGNIDEIEVTDKSSFYSIQQEEKGKREQTSEANNKQLESRQECMFQMTHKKVRRHIQQPLDKLIPSVLKKPKRAGMNPFIEEDFEVDQKGLVLCVNQKKLEIQNSLLKRLLKQLMDKLRSGQRLQEISMPVEIFFTESDLSQACKALRYAPSNLQKAAKQVDPVQRMKHIVSFAVGYCNAYLTMQKPFNPILGQTYQCLIDGCPVYGEQISHHPPISSVLMKGRGYTIYGSLELWAKTGITSVTAGNIGIIFISFSSNSLRENLIKINFPPVEFKGFVFGKRSIKNYDKYRILDENNRLFLDLNVSKHKGVTEFCNYQNGVEGRLVKLRPNVDLQVFPELKVKKQNIQMEYGIFSGKWTNYVFYEDEELIDFCRDFPHASEEYLDALPSNVKNRKDLLLLQERKIEQAQQMKDQMEVNQRRDRKLQRQFFTESVIKHYS